MVHLNLHLTACLKKGKSEKEQTRPITVFIIAATAMERKEPFGFAQGALRTRSV
jgi:hypothetical protein